MDHGAEVADVLLGEFAPDGREVDGAARLLEGAVDGIVGDAGAVGLVRGRGRGTAECSPRLRVKYYIVMVTTTITIKCSVQQDENWKCH